MTLTNGIGLPESIGWNAPSWSVSSEMAAYLVFPIFTLILSRQSQGPYRVLASIIFIVVLTTALGWITTGGSSYLMGDAFKLVRVWSAFLIGCFIFQLHRLQLRLPFSSMCVCATAFIIVVSSMDFPARWGGIFILAFAVLLYSLTQQQHFISRLLSKKPAVYLGEISYSLYLCHGVLFMVLNQGFQKLFFQQYPQHISPWVIVVCLISYILLPIVTSHFLYQWIEIPGRNWLKTKFALQPEPSPQLESVR